MLTAFEFGYERPAAGGNQDALGRIGFVTHPDFMLADNLRTAVNQVTAGILHQLGINAVETADFLLFVVSESGPVELNTLRGQAVTGCLMKGFGIVRGIDIEFLRHTADIDTGTAQIKIFGDRHFHAFRCRHATGAYTTGTCADHEQVIIKFCHCASLNTFDVSNHCNQPLGSGPIVMAPGSHCEKLWLRPDDDALSGTIAFSQ